MKIVFPENVSGKKKRVIMRELVQGQESAKQLKLLLQKPFGADEFLSVKELVDNVQRSFTESLSVLTSPDVALGGDEVAHRNLSNSGDDIPRSEESNESRKGSLPAKKDRRGCYKRRKSGQAWTRVSPTPDDNHSWRKYGQKEILNAKFPRSYFRCTKRFDQDCRATKQVQRTQENPDMYQVTYIGIHTCKATPKASHLVMDTSNWESYLVNSKLDDLKVPSEQDQPISLPSQTIVKQEYPKEDTPSDITDHKLDPTQFADLKDFEAFKPATTMPLKMASYYENTVHSSTSSQSLDMDFGEDSVHFSTDFHFDGIQLL